MLVESPSANDRHFLLLFVTVLHAVAAVTTCLRLWVRLRPVRRFWWEETWAFMALCSDVVCVISIWMLAFPEYDHPWYMSRKSHLVSVWLQLESYTALKWTSKISILYSFTRMVPASCRMRRISSGFILSFFFLWALCAVSKTYACGSNVSWENLAMPQCTFGPSTAIIEFTAAVVSDIVLIALPTHILYQMRLPKHERLLILSVFLTNLLSGLVSIVHLTFLIPKMGFMASMTGDMEGAIDLLNCNLLVLVTNFFEGGWASMPEGADDGMSVRTMTTAGTLTTVDPAHVDAVSIYSTQSAPVPRSREVLSYTLASRSCCNMSAGHEHLSSR